MASGRDASDWTVEHAGDEGAIWCHEYRGRFRVRNAGVVHIIWQGGGPGPAENGPVGRAAHEAIDAAIRSQSGS
ncbi:hypothetical protein QFZ27_005988 [Inquilinus ginsengisoli]|jgi:hypothetical protein